MRLQPVEIAARCELLGSLHETAKAPQEASVLLSGLEAGRWPISKGTFASDYPKVKELAGQPAETHALDTRLAGAETVESGWDDWQLVQRSGSRSVTKSWHNRGRSPFLGLLERVL